MSFLLAESFNQLLQDDILNKRTRGEVLVSFDYFVSSMALMILSILAPVSGKPSPS